MDSGNNGNGTKDEINAMLDRFEKRGKDSSPDSGMSTVSRVGAAAPAFSVIATVDSKGVFKGQKELELLVDLIARTNFRSRNERIYFLDWIEWLLMFGVDLTHAILYVASARSEGGESINQLIEALTAIRNYQYQGQSNKSKGVEKSPQGSSGLVSG